MFPGKSASAQPATDASEAKFSRQCYEVKGADDDPYAEIRSMCVYRIVTGKSGKPKPKMDNPDRQVA